MTSPDEQLQAARQADAARFLDKIRTLEISINGVPIPDLQRYRVQTPAFSLVVAPSNWFGLSVTAGKDHRTVAVGEGYFVLLPPFPVGKHVIQLRVQGTNPENNKPLNDVLTANLIIQEPNKALE
jgi:hypothetical protein